MRMVVYLPALLAALTDCAVALVVGAVPQDYPGRVVVLQIAMLAAALLVALPYRRVRFTAFLLMSAGAFACVLSVGVWYVPTVIAAAWSVSRRSAPQERRA